MKAILKTYEGIIQQIRALATFKKTQQALTGKRNARDFWGCSQHSNGQDGVSFTVICPKKK